MSLHVYATPEILDRIVAGIRDVLDDHLHDRDIYAWRFTLPVDAEDVVHRDLAAQWRERRPERAPGAERAYEVALSLVGDPAELTDTDIADLEHGIALAVYAADTDVPFTLRAHQRTDVVVPELDHELR
ncbi:hypothetical protein [Nocardia lasii]|uniref:Uncharacterized protein n=1 Tax=Nocardia lasii TaxID=1616107 RepID=A0ABW1JZ51_9NOCA